MRHSIVRRLAPLGLALASSGAAAGPIPPPPAKYEIRLDRSVFVPMRDGTLLSTDLYFPVGAEEPLPVVLVRTPYNKKSHRREGSDARVFAGQGYVVAVQDVRGKFESGGTFTIHKADGEDGYDAVEWLSKQKWSSGKVGTYGCSYLGESQMQLASKRHPAHAAAIIQAAGGAYGGGGRQMGGWFSGGVFDLRSGLEYFRAAASKYHNPLPTDIPRETLLQLADLLTTGPEPPERDLDKAVWGLPTIGLVKATEGPPTDYEAFLSTPFSDPWWRSLGAIYDEDRFDVPSIHVTSWYDPGQREVLDLMNLMARNATSERGRHQIALVGPGGHCSLEEGTEDTVYGERKQGDTRIDAWSIYLRWFDRWLRGTENGAERMPKLRIFVMGKGWREESEWPLARTRWTKLYLASGGRANSRFGDGRLVEGPTAAEGSFDRFYYDPRTPVPTLGGSFGAGDIVDGPHDQSAIETRHDVLVYTSEPFANGVEVTGPMEAVLYVSSSARDTDFTVKLVDVAPDGAAYNIEDGILRARYRESLEKPAFMEPGEVYELRIDLHATSNYFAPGHRIRLEVSSSSFPRYERNLNTGGNNYDETDPVAAENVVHHTARHPSYILLPVVP